MAVEKSPGVGDVALDNACLANLSAEIRMRSVQSIANVVSRFGASPLRVLPVGLAGQHGLRTGRQHRGQARQRTLHVVPIHALDRQVILGVEMAGRLTSPCALPGLSRCHRSLRSRQPNRQRTFNRPGAGGLPVVIAASHRKARGRAFRCGFQG